tara:strand:+ start:1231 stop:2136 length:906 start_codon:yes stop_codon:yes gene_type:complete
MHTTYTNAIDQLQASIAELRVLKKKELNELFIKYRKWIDNKSNCGAKVRKEAKEAHELIVLHNLKLVVKIAHQYKWSGMEPEDLINEGTIGLLDAVDRFDINNGAKFSTYSALWIKQKIRRSLSNKSRTIRFPTHVADKIGKIKTFQSNFIQEHNRNPTVSEIKENVRGISKAILNDLINGGVINLSSLDMKMSQEGDGEATLGDLTQDEKIISPDKGGEHEDNVSHLTFYLSKLKRREKHIIKRRFGLGGKKPETLEQIAKSYGVSRERIRQIQTEAMRKLRYHMGRKYGENFFIPMRQF